MIGSIVSRAVIATVITIDLVAAVAGGTVDNWDLLSAAIAGILWWTLLVDWRETR